MYDKIEKMGKDEYYLGIAKAVSQRSSCLRKHYGAVIVKNDEIISTGYNGAPRGEIDCYTLGFCGRDKVNAPEFEGYNICHSVHAEMNAIISASRADMLGGKLYLYGFDMVTGEPIASPDCCPICARLIKNAGLTLVNKVVI